MDAYDRYTNIEKNLADSVAVYCRVRERCRPPTYLRSSYLASYRIIYLAVLQNISMPKGYFAILNRKTPFYAKTIRSPPV
jgi:hypothetical protein